MTDLGKQILRLVEIFGLPLVGMQWFHTLHTRQNELFLFFAPLLLVGIRLVFIKALLEARINESAGSQAIYARQAIRAEQVALIPLFLFEVASVLAESISSLTFFLCLCYVIYVLMRFVGLRYGLTARAIQQGSD